MSKIAVVLSILHKNKSRPEAIKRKISSQSESRKTGKMYIISHFEHPKSKLEGAFKSRLFRGNWPEKPYDIHFFKQ